MKFPIPPPSDWRHFPRTNVRYAARKQNAKKKNHYQMRLQGASEIESTLRHFRTACTDEALNQYYDSSTSLHKITTNHTQPVQPVGYPCSKCLRQRFGVGRARNLRRYTLHRTGTVPHPHTGTSSLTSNQTEFRTPGSRSLTNSARGRTSKDASVGGVFAANTWTAAPERKAYK